MSTDGYKSTDLSGLVELDLREQERVCRFASLISNLPEMPTEAELRELEDSELVRDAEVNAVDAESALLRAIDRLADAKATVLVLAYLGWSDAQGGDVAL